VEQNYLQNVWVTGWGFVSKDISKFRQNAEECFVRARDADDGARRAHWLGMAQYWLTKAEVDEAAAKTNAQQK
jgi:hypothetical protein